MALAERAFELPPPNDLVALAADYLSPNSLVADLGASDSYNGIFLAERGHRVIAVELDHQLARRGKMLQDKLGYGALSLSIIQANIMNLPLKDGVEFDAAVCTSVIPILSPRETAYRAIDKIMGITRSGGINAVDVIVGNPNYIRKRASMGYYAFSENEIIEHYYRSGWKIENRQFANEFGEPEDANCSFMLERVIAIKPRPQTYMNANRQLVTLE